MKFSKLATLFSFLVLAIFIYLSVKTLMPSGVSDASAPETVFSTERALNQLKVISEKPHYIGSTAHAEVREYLIAQLELLGLEPHVQEGFTLNKKWSVLAKPKNILARIPGSEQGKALMLLAHYDSAPHSNSYGASDAGSGIVAILEGVRSYLASGQVPKNDIVILFSDAEEIGLLGAKLFVEEHPWVNDVGVVFNFEARGSGGPSNMILETNGGNAVLIKEFMEADPSHPLASSLMYSVYKMLPNDTDSTIFREQADIDSYFFAFIDDFFDYHTVNDTYENLDRNTLEHQGRYVTAVLNHFTQSDLNNLKSEKELVYFSVPLLKMVSYPFSWIVPMLLFVILLFTALIFYGISQKKLHLKEIIKGFVPFFSVLILSGLLGYFGWKLLLRAYPGYGEILHGFTYNGHLYIAAFVAITLAIAFYFYRRFHRKEHPVNFFIAPLFFWIVLCALLAIYLQGAAYFIIPVFFSLMMLLVLIKQKQPNVGLLLVLCAPIIFILAPYIQFFPIGLELKMLVASTVFTVLLFGLILPVPASFRYKNSFVLFFFVLGIGFFVSAHFQSGFTEDRQKPNSLIYYHDADKQESYWATYDKVLDDWTQNVLGDSPGDASSMIANVTGSKYGTGLSYAVSTLPKDIPLPEITLLEDRTENHFRKVSFLITPQRRVNRLALFADKEVVFTDFMVNGQNVPKDEVTGNAYENRQSNRLLSYYVSDQDSLEVTYRIPEENAASITLLEISFDLLEQDQFAIPERAKNEMPKPFVNTDAVIVQKTIDVNTLTRVDRWQQNQGENETN